MVNEAKISKHAPTGFGPKARIGDNTGHLESENYDEAEQKHQQVDESTSNHLIIMPEIKNMATHKKMPKRVSHQRPLY